MTKNDILLLDYFAGQALSGIISAGNLKAKETQVALSYDYAEMMIMRKEKGKDEFAKMILNRPVSSAADLLEDENSDIAEEIVKSIMKEQNEKQ